MEFLYYFDCILSHRKKLNLLRKIGKTLQLPPSKRSIENFSLIAAQDHDLPRCCEGFIKCKTVDQEVSKTQQTETIVQPKNSLKTNHIY